MLAVTGIGMVSSLGLNAVTSCAAARAGIRRVGKLNDVFVWDDGAEDLVPLVASQVPIVSNGLFGFARLLQLAICAIDDLRRTYVARGDRPVGLILVVRSEWHRTAWIEHRKQAAAKGGPGEQESDFASDEHELARDTQRLAEALLPAIAARAQIVTHPQAQHTILGDQSGFVVALEQAAAWLAKGVCETCLVGGVDSYLDPASIEALDGLNLLRTAANPAGPIPGELACFLALTMAGEHPPPGALALIESFCHSTGATPRSNDGFRTPEPLLQAMATAGRNQNIELAVVNLNGDAVRGAEWGTVLVRRRSQGLTDAPSLWIPPLHFGEIGSATGPASVALLARGWARGYAPSRKAMVCLMEDGAARGAISLMAP